MKESLLNLIQKEFPLTKRPFASLAKELNTTEEKILNLYKELKEERIIRQTSAIFDTKSLGYSSSLVAFKTDNIEDAAKFINTHPGVSHNYERDNEYNLWFTIAVEPNSSLGLEKTVELMAKKVNAKDYIILPTLKMFKISVQLDIKGNRAKRERIKKHKKEKIKLSDFDMSLINLLQEDIKSIYEPYEHIIKSLDIDYERLQKEAEKYKNSGVMRRFASILYHRRAGFKANAMVIWRIPKEKENQIEEIGTKMASFSAVSHCYQRPVFPNWPYSLFTMIHGKTKEEVDEVVNDIENETNIYDHKYLYSTREFKKQRIKYFSPKFKEWELKNG